MRPGTIGVTNTGLDMRHTRVIVGLMLLAVALTSCRSPSPGDERAATATAQARAQRTKVLPPPGLDAAAITPATGEARQRAELPLDQVLAEVPSPGYLTNEPSASPPNPPSLEAQRLYLSARAAWREGRNFDAIKHLQQALRTAPERAEILRLLGRIYATIGNRVRGTQYLREAVQADPTDVDALVDLGRHALEASEWTEAIAIFNAAAARVATQPDPDPALRRLLRHYLATALMREGYAGAAVEAYEAFLAGAAGGSQTTPWGREAEILDQQAGATWQALGDLYHRLDRPARALEAYTQAGEAGVIDGTGLVRRLVYTYLRLGRESEAEQLVIRRVDQSGADVPTLALVRYLGEQGAGLGGLVSRLESLYVREGRPTSLLLALTDVLPADDAEALLVEHLEAKPEDLRILDHLLRRFMMPDGAGTAPRARVGEAVRRVARLMDAAPEHAEAMASMLMQAAVDRDALLAAIDAMPAEEQAVPQTRVLRATALAATGVADRAEAELRAALDADPDLLVARVQLVKLLVLRERFDEAAGFLSMVEASKDPAVVSLRVLVLSRTGQAEEAIALLEELIRGGPVDTGLILQKASLHLRAGDAAAAERTLLDALNVRPEDERIYEAMLDLYDPSTGQSPIEDSMRQWQRLVRRLLGTIPQSRIARLVRAELHEAKGEVAQAEGLLRELIEENEGDARALEQLLSLYLSTNRRDEAIQLLEGRLTQNSQDQKLLLMVGLAYKRLGEEQKLLETVERYLHTRPASQDRDLSLALLALEADRPDRARELAESVYAQPEVEDPLRTLEVLGEALADLDQLDEAEKRYAGAMARFANHAADLAHARANLVLVRGGDRRSMELMESALRQWPDHAGMNNGLGYHLVVKGEDLERAQQLIQRAVDAEPGTSAYLDSLGWAYYMQGRFDDAVTWLQQARQQPGGGNPVIIDHLGDALFRLGRRQEAVQNWTQAKTMMERLLARDLDRTGEALYQMGRVADAVRLWSRARQLERGEVPYEDPEMRTLVERVEAKVRATRRNRAVPVTPLPDEPAAAMVFEGDGDASDAAEPDAEGAAEGDEEPAADAVPMGE